MALNSAPHNQSPTPPASTPENSIWDGILTQVESNGLREMIKNNDPFLTKKLEEIRAGITDKTSKETADFKNFLEREMAQESVKILQWQWQISIYDINTMLGVNASSYTHETFYALMEFQKKHNLDVNGLPVIETLNKLVQLSEKKDLSEKMNAYEYAEANEVPEQWRGVLEDFFAKCSKEQREKITTRSVIAIASKKSGKAYFIAGKSGEDNFEFRIRLGKNGTTTSWPKPYDRKTPTDRVLRCNFAKIPKEPYGRAANSKDNTSVRGASWQGPEMSSMWGRWWHGVSKNREKEWENDTLGCVGMKVADARRWGRIINEKKWYGIFLYVSESVKKGDDHNLQPDPSTHFENFTSIEIPSKPLASWDELQQELADAYYVDSNFDVGNFMEKRLANLDPVSKQNLFGELAQKTSSIETQPGDFSVNNLMVSALVHLTSALFAPDLKPVEPMNGVLPTAEQQSDAFKKLLQIAHKWIHTTGIENAGETITPEQRESFSEIPLMASILNELPAGYESMDIATIATSIVDDFAESETDPESFRRDMQQLSDNQTVSLFVQSHVDSLTDDQQEKIYQDLVVTLKRNKTAFYPDKFDPSALAYQILIYVAYARRTGSMPAIESITMDGIIESETILLYEQCILAAFDACGHTYPTPAPTDTPTETVPSMPAEYTQLTTENYDFNYEHLSENAREKLISYDEAIALIENPNTDASSNNEKIIYKIRPETIPLDIHTITSKGVHRYKENTDPDYYHPSSTHDAQIRQQALGANGKQYIAVHRTAMPTDRWAFNAMMKDGRFPYIVTRWGTIIQGPNEMYTGACVSTKKADANLASIYGEGINHQGIAIEVCLGMNEDPSSAQANAVRSLLLHLGQKHSIPKSRFITSADLIRKENGVFMDWNDENDYLHTDDYINTIAVNMFGMLPQRERLALIHSGNFIHQIGNNIIGYPGLPDTTVDSGVQVASLGNMPTYMPPASVYMPPASIEKVSRTPTTKTQLEQVNYGGHTFDIVPKTHPLIAQHDIVSYILLSEWDSGSHKDNIGIDYGWGINSGSIEGKWATGGVTNISAGQARGPVEKMCQARIATAMNLCKEGSPSIDFDGLPVFAQKVLVDMCYNMTGGKGPTKSEWPTFWKNISNGEWNKAGLELLTGSAQGGTSKYVNDVYARAYMNARVLQTGEHSKGQIEAYRAEWFALYNNGATKAQGLRTGYKNLMANYQDVPKSYVQQHNEQSAPTISPRPWTEFTQYNPNIHGTIKRNSKGLMVSQPYEKSASWVTLCSWTTFKNLAQLLGGWLQWDADKVYNKYKNGERGPGMLEFLDGDFSEGTPHANVADILLDSPQKSHYKRDYGHRVAAYKKEWEWYVIDPYYNAGSSRTQQPRSLRNYLQWFKDTDGYGIRGTAYYYSDKV